MIDPNHPFRLFLQGIYKQNTPEALAKLEEWSGQIYGMKKTLRNKLITKARLKWRQLSVKEAIATAPCKGCGVVTFTKDVKNAVHRFHAHDCPERELK